MYGERSDGESPLTVLAEHLRVLGALNQCLPDDPKRSGAILCTQLTSNANKNQNLLLGLYPPAARSCDDLEEIDINSIDEEMGVPLLRLVCARRICA